MQRTVKIAIKVPDNFLEFMETCSLMYNEYINWCFKTKSHDKVKAHRELYSFFRKKYPNVPSGLIQTIRDNALESIKSLKSKKITSKPVKKPHSAIRYNKTTMNVIKPNSKYNKSNEKLLTFACPNGLRFKQNIIIPSWFLKKYSEFNFQAGNICYNFIKKQFYVDLTYIAPDVIKKEFHINKIIGVDRGLYNIIAISDGLKINSKQIRKNKRRYLYIRKKLQAKGTLSAKRKLRKRSGKEARFSLNQNHIISKMLVNLPYDIFVLEDLTNIVNRSKNLGKKNNKMFRDWTFYQLERLLIYKTEALGKSIVKVDARYTSQKCSECGNIDKNSRNKDKYCCVKCGHTEHADTNAAKNIKNNYLTSLLAFSKKENGQKQAAINQPNGQISNNCLMYQQKSALKILHTKC